MRFAFCAAFTWLLYSLSDHLLLAQAEKHYLNEWAAEIPGGHDVARRVAEQHGYILVRELQSLPDHYLLHRSDTPHRSRRSAHHHTKKLADDNRVLFVEQQHAKVRVKRDFLEDVDPEVGNRAAVEILPNDPSFEKQWYLNPSGVRGSRSSQPTDLRVIDTWRKGITGKDITVCILDDGIEKDHPDLAPNYDPYSSFDLNSNDTDPTPRYEITNENKHGTRCAGEIAMVANNNNCGVGVAYNSKIGGIRMLDGVVTDRLEAEAFGFNVSHVNIFSASFGPTDDGAHMEKPGPLAQRAFMKGITKGRNGKGVLYAWASGNGGRLRDNCNADGYSASIYTIAISSGNQNGRSPWYAEQCSSTMATTYSSGNHNEGMIISTDLKGKCTDQHSGTSAAAPMAAGLLALLLEANPDLTWRDVQHIIAHTSRKSPLASENGWYKNAAGYCVNLRFGFGLMDALGMVELAQDDRWKNVGPQHVCRVEASRSDQFPVTLTGGEFIDIDFTTDGCKGQNNEVNYLEHVVVNLDLQYPQRGRIGVELESPEGTNVTIMLERDYDKATSGFEDWPLMSVHTWGEKPQGTWKLRIVDRIDDGMKGALTKVSLVLYGTKELPEYRKTHPKDCDDDLKTTEKPDLEAGDETIEKLNQLLKTESRPHVIAQLKEFLKQKDFGLADENAVKRLLSNAGYYDTLYI